MKNSNLSKPNIPPQSRDEFRKFWDDQRKWMVANKEKHNQLVDQIREKRTPEGREKLDRCRNINLPRSQRWRFPDLDERCARLEELTKEITSMVEGNNISFVFNCIEFNVTYPQFQRGRTTTKMTKH